MTRYTSEESSDGVLVSCTTERTTTVALLTTSLAVCASLWVASAAMKSDDKEREQDADYDKFNDVKGLAETIVARTRAIERMVAWQAWWFAKLLEGSFGLKARWRWRAIEFRLVAWSVMGSIKGRSAVTWWTMRWVYFTIWFIVRSIRERFMVPFMWWPHFAVWSTMRSFVRPRWRRRHIIVLWRRWGRREFSAMRRWRWVVRRLGVRTTLLRRRWVATNWERLVRRLLPVRRFLPVRRSCMVSVLRWASVVSRFGMFRLLWPVRLEFGEMIKLLVIKVMMAVMAMDLVEHFVSSVTSFIDDCLGKTL